MSSFSDTKKQNLAESSDPSQTNDAATVFGGTTGITLIIDCIVNPTQFTLPCKLRIPL